MRDTAAVSPAGIAAPPPAAPARPAAPAEPPWVDPPFNVWQPTIDGNLTVFDDGTNQWGQITCRVLNAQQVNAQSLGQGLMMLNAPAGTALGGAGGTVTAATITSAQALGFQGLFLDPRYVWDLSGLVINGVTNFTIESKMAGSIGWLGSIAYNTGGYCKTDTGALTDGIQVYASSPAVSPTQGVIFRGLVLVGANPGSVIHFGGGQRRCGLVDTLTYNTKAASTTVAAGSNGVNVSTFAGAQSLQVASSASLPSSGNLILATGTGAAIVSYNGTGAGVVNNVNLIGGAGVLATGGAVTLAAFGVQLDTGLSNNNSEDNLFSFTGGGGIACAPGGGAALGIGVADQSQHANDTSWYDLVTAGGQHAIVGALGSNHVLYNYYDRSSPALATVANHGSIFTFIGGEDQNGSANGVAHLLDGASAITTLINRIMTQVTAANIASLSNGNLVLRGRIRLPAGAIAISGGNVDLSDPAGNYGGLSITGAGGKLVLAPVYSPGSPPTVSGYTGTIVYLGPGVQVNQAAQGQTTTQTITWTPPAQTCAFRVSVWVRPTVAGTSTVVNLAFSEIFGTAFNQNLPMWPQDGAATAPVYSITVGSKDYLGTFTGKTDASAGNVTVTITPTGSTFRYVVVIEQLTQS